MIVSDAIAYAQRVAGILGVGQVALPQDTSDAQIALQLMLQQWRQKRWLVFRLNWDIVPLVVGKQSYTVGGAAENPDFVTDGVYRPANIQSCFLRQNTGAMPSAFPIDFPMRILMSRQEYDSISLKYLGSWPCNVYYDPTLPVGTLYIWPIPIQTFFSLYIAWQQDVDVTSDQGMATEISAFVPPETQEAIIYNLALRLETNYKLPPDPAIAAAARATLNTLRQTNWAMQPAKMPSAIRARGRLRNPMGGFNYPEISAGVPVGVLGG